MHGETIKIKNAISYCIALKYSVSATSIIDSEGWVGNVK